MATGTFRTHLTRDDVMAILDDADELDDCFAPGSDDELGFEDDNEEEIEENEMYMHNYTVKHCIYIILPGYCLNREIGDDERLDDDHLHFDNDNRPEDNYNGVRCVIIII